jgi:hypothetical protein
MAAAAARAMLRRPKGGAVGTFWAIVTIAVVVGVGLLAVWALVVAPWRVPTRPTRH